jgi:hypothetical protein
VKNIHFSGLDVEQNNRSDMFPPDRRDFEFTESLAFARSQADDLAGRNSRSRFERPDDLFFSANGSSGRFEEADGHIFLPMVTVGMGIEDGVDLFPHEMAHVFVAQEIGGIDDQGSFGRSHQDRRVA